MPSGTLGLIPHGFGGEGARGRNAIGSRLLPVFISPGAGWADKNPSKLPSFNCQEGEKVLRSLVCVSDDASKAKERNDGIMAEVLGEVQE